MRHLVDVGGAELEAVLEGHGSLTVVFENGLATPLEFWDAVAPEVAKRARILRYNRRWATPAGPLTHRSHSEIDEDLDDLHDAHGVGFDPVKVRVFTSGPHDPRQGCPTARSL